MKIVILWTDALIFLLIAVSVVSALWIRKRPHLLLPWQRVAKSSTGMVSLLVLSLFLIVGLLDSLHYRAALPEKNNGQTVDVAYEISTPPLRMFLCHCSRCRRGRSAAHCANLFYKAEGFRWTRGAGQVQTSPCPARSTSARRSAGAAGPRCPASPSNATWRWSPAGSLDSDPGIAPKGHIYVDTRAAWFDVTDDLPKFAEMPPRR